ncbi:hypothetical protein AVEN_187266-1 [Araneus ventricosus]|uniref:Uncharacterized protein n=1 Tax=Araneus ventricosus TaxID=182803 RepID=A0A4Y1ZY00_ARAVE|nr:hypothetical protein AVEN_187266-1 [Araneus ventricosus]
MTNTSSPINELVMLPDGHFPFMHLTADDHLEPEDLDNEECIICSEQEENGIWTPMFYVQALAPPVLAVTKSKPMEMQFL